MKCDTTYIIMMQNGNQINSELASRIQQVETEVEAQESKLMEKDQLISHLKSGLRRAENRVSVNQNRALRAENEVKTVERQKEQLQSKIDQMRDEIHELKKANALKLNQAKEDTEKLVTEKESELREVNRKLEEKEMELHRQRMEIERVSRRLEEAEKDVAKKSNKIIEHEMEKVILRSELHTMIKKMEMLTESVWSNTGRPTNTMKTVHNMLGLQMCNIIIYYVSLFVVGSR